MIAKAARPALSVATDKIKKKRIGYCCQHTPLTMNSYYELLTQYARYECWLTNRMFIALYSIK